MRGLDPPPPETISSGRGHLISHIGFSMIDGKYFSLFNGSQRCVNNANKVGLL